MSAVGAVKIEVFGPENHGNKGLITMKHSGSIIYPESTQVVSELVDGSKGRWDHLRELTRMIFGVIPDLVIG